MSKTTSKQRDNGAEDYSYTVAWSDEDDAFIARVTEFPSLAAHGNSPELALQEMRKVVDLVIEDIEDGISADRVVANFRLTGISYSVDELRTRQGL